MGWRYAPPRLGTPAGSPPAAPEAYTNSCCTPPLKGSLGNKNRSVVSYEIIQLSSLHYWLLSDECCNNNTHTKTPLQSHKAVRVKEMKHTSEHTCFYFLIPLRCTCSALVEVYLLLHSRHPESSVQPVFLFLSLTLLDDLIITPLF